MTAHGWQSLGTQAGAGLWAGASFLFPAFSVWHDASVALAMVLYVLETVLASFLLAVRIAVARRARAGTPEARGRLQRALRLLAQLVIPFSIVPGMLLLGYALIDEQQGRLTLDVAWHAERARWMAFALVAGATLDSLLAPVRSVIWLESAAAWQASRTSVLVVAFLIGTPIMLYSGSSQAYFWVWFGLRLLSDVNALRPTERERLRLHFLGPDARVFGSS
jgi:hypothetical protein